MKKLLVLNFFPAFVPPKSGGELRYFHFYRCLSASHDVTLLSPTYSHHQEEVIRHHEHFREYRVPKQEVHDRLHARVAEDRIGSECSALVCALSARYPNRYHQLYLELHADADIIIHEFPYLLEYDLFFGLDGKPRIYNSHNFESHLVAQLWSGPNADKYRRYIHRLEKKLVCKSDLVFAVCQEERCAMAAEFGIAASKIGLAPNGINLEDYPADWDPLQASGKLQAFFIGAQHPPNLDAARFICRELAAQCPDIQFVIAGDCCVGLEQGLPDNVRLLGRISEEDKRRRLKASRIAINPMSSGAGTNLKTLEYLAAGLPLVSTKIGVRGLDLSGGEHFIAAERAEFAKVLRELVHDPARLETVAANGRRRVLTGYAWDGIVAGFEKSLAGLAKRETKPLLVLNDFQVKDHTFGGAVRIRRLYSELSRQRPVLLVTLNNEGTLDRFDPTSDFAELSFPKTDRHIQEENRLNACSDISVGDIVTSIQCRRNDLLRAALRCALGFAGAVVLSHPYMAALIEGRPKVPIVYESHNFEYRLKQGLLKKHPSAKDLLARVKTVETIAVRLSSLVIAVSAQNARELARFYDLTKDVEVIENGVDPGGAKRAELNLEPVRRLFRGQPVAVFIGSAHRPNVEAVEYLLEELAPLFGQVYFLVIGNVCDAVCRALPENVLFFRELDEARKNALLQAATVALNPIFSGSGSNLKLAEYFAHGLPTVTTSFGARGYQIVPGQQALIGSPEEFPELLRRLLGNRELQRSMSERARDYVRTHHDWRDLAGKYDALLQERIFARNRVKLLVVTHRFTLPPLGGAELYLWNVLKELDASGALEIDVVAPGIRALDNRMHFATRVTTDDAPAFEMVSNHLSVLRFPPVDVPEKEVEEQCRKLHDLWYEESIRISLKNADRYDHPLLLGGWNYPERLEDGSVRIWTSGRALIWVRGLDSVRIRAVSPRARSVSCRLDGNPVSRKKWRGVDRWNIPVAGGKVLELSIEGARGEQNDPRRLGLLVESIRLETGGILVDLDLAGSYRDFLKQHHLESYLLDLGAIARHREPSQDERFQRVRGPVADGLEAWISEHVDDYDVVLGHGTPFQPFVIAARQTAAHGKPCVLLPHFHFDDEFYHWKSFYEAMQSAARVFAFPEVALSLFYQPLSICTCYLPGGAVDPKEFDRDRRSAFHRVCRPSLPFFLVLGRKSPSKNYQWVIDAVRAVNESQELCQLVMIGPDDDHRPVPGDAAIYLGRQPREVVLGALQDCCGLINMSASESFGMVVLEAWMCRKPVIVNRNCRAFRELVTDGENGLLADRSGLVECIRMLLSGPERAEHLGGNGFRSVGENYTWKHIADTVGRVLSELVAAEPTAAVGKSPRKMEPAEKVPTDTEDLLH